MIINDVTSPAALLFVDAVGETLPSKASFTFKELCDFCHREGVNGLIDQQGALASDTLITIARKIAAITKGHIIIEPRPRTGRQRMPLSRVDMDVADHVAKSETGSCRKCGTTTDHLLYCETCRKVTADMLFGAPSPPRPNKKHVLEEKKKHNPIEIGASVVLETGLKVHVVATTGPMYIGVDDELNTHEFSKHQATDIRNLTDAVTIKIAKDHCPMCGEETRYDSEKCTTCGSDVVSFHTEKKS